MAFELHLSIPDHSPAVHLVQRVAAAEHISIEQAATQLLVEVARQQSKRMPGDELIGLLSGDEDTAILDEAMEFVRERRHLDGPRNFDL